MALRTGLQLHRSMAQRTRARSSRRSLGKDFEDLPRDANWLPRLAKLSEVVVYLDDAPAPSSSTASR